MKTKCTVHHLLLALLAIAVLAAAVPANATFVVDPNPGGDFYYLDGPNKDVDHFSGEVGGQHSGVFVDANVVMNVDTANGYATIKPTDDTVDLTYLLFTPRDSSLFGDFSFRGQLEDTANGTVHVEVIDQLGIAFDFDFTGLGSNTDFDRIGVHSTDGESIKSVAISAIEDGFKEVKQINFSGTTGGNGGGGGGEVPEPGTVILLGAGLFGLGLFGKKFRN